MKSCLEICVSALVYNRSYLVLSCTPRFSRESEAKEEQCLSQIPSGLHLAVLFRDHYHIFKQQSLFGLFALLLQLF